MLFDHRTLIDQVESIQFNFNKKLFGFEDLTYNNRLRVLIADNLVSMWINADLLFYYQTFHKLVDLEEFIIVILNNANFRGDNFNITKSYLKVASAYILF